MPAKFSQNIRSFIGSSFVNSIHLKRPDPWRPSVPVTSGTVISYGNSKYVAITSGTTGSLPPTHTNGIQSDGGVDWVFVESIPLNESYKGNLYLFIGKTSEWTDENNPPNPDTSDINDYVTLKDIIALKKITDNDLTIGIRRHDWVSGQIYSQYDSEKDPFDQNSYENPFYVVTDDLNIYKCLNNNNNSPSLSKPTGTSSRIINLADGYSWKYMGSIRTGQASRFLTSDFVPVEYKTYDDGSDQWIVQQNAKPKSISTFKILRQTGLFNSPVVTIIGKGTGASAFATKTPTNAIRQVLISDPGTGYDSETYAIVKESGVSGSGAIVNVESIDPVTGKIQSLSIANGGSEYTEAIAIITGDGEGAVASVTVGPDGSIQSVDIVNGGKNYTTAKVWIIPGNSGAVAKAVLAPINGHGSNIVSELGASTVIVSISISNNEKDYFPIGVENSFRQVGIITDVKDSSGYANSLNYIGPAHREYNNRSSALNKINEDSGYILYLSNIKSVTRSDGQEEHFKVAIVF